MFKKSCGCQPGTYDNGWKEQVSEECKAIELEQWAVAVKLGRQLAYKEYKKTHTGFDCLVAYPDEYFEDGWEQAEVSVNRSIARQNPKDHG